MNFKVLLRVATIFCIMIAFCIQISHAQSSCQQEIANYCNINDRTHNPGSVLPAQACFARLSAVFQNGRVAALDELENNHTEAGGLGGGNSNRSLEYGRVMPNTNDYKVHSRPSDDYAQPLWACASTLSAEAVQKQARAEPKHSGCLDPPSFQIHADIEEYGGGDNPLRYCVPYISNSSVYPIMCDVPLGSVGVMPGEKDHMAVGWALNPGDSCAAEAHCKKDLVTMRVAKRWCQGEEDMPAQDKAPDAEKACDAPPNYQTRAAVEEYGDGPNPLHYCVMYASNSSPYPLDCNMGGRHVGVMPGEKDHLIQGWYLNPGDVCEATVTCNKDVKTMNVTKRWCQGR